MSRILMVLTSHDELGDTGHKTGFWLEEFASPYYVFIDAGHDVTLASPQGGRPPVDPNSARPEMATDATRRLESDEKAQLALDSTVELSSVDPVTYDAVFYPGGHGPLWDLDADPNSQRIITATWEAGLPLGLVCHAPGVLRNSRTANGEVLVAGRRVTGFTNGEEEAAGLTDVVPYLVEDALHEAGARYEKGEDNASHVVTDGLLVTGQNPASSADAARSLLALLA